MHPTPAALCSRGHVVAAVCPLLPLQYLILPFEFILSFHVKIYTAQIQTGAGSSPKFSPWSISQFVQIQEENLGEVSVLE